MLAYLQCNGTADINQMSMTRSGSSVLWFYLTRIKQFQREDRLNKRTKSSFSQTTFLNLAYQF